MITEQLVKNKLVGGVFWPPAGEAYASPERLQSVSRALTRQYRTVSYPVSAHPGQMEYGYFEYQTTVYEPIALYILSLFGDGFYYSRNDNGDVYLLVIFDGRILPGTDVLINSVLFETLLRNKPLGIYKDLPVYELNEEHLQRILESYQRHQHQMKKKRYLKLSVFISLTAILAIIPVFIIMV